MVIIYFDVEIPKILHLNILYNTLLKMIQNDVDLDAFNLEFYYPRFKLKIDLNNFSIEFIEKVTYFIMQNTSMRFTILLRNKCSNNLKDEIR